MADGPNTGGEIVIEMGAVEAATVPDLTSIESGDVNETDGLLQTNSNQTEQGTQLNKEHVYPQQAQQAYARHLREIEDIGELRLILREWEKMFKLARERIEKKNTRVFNAKSEIYQLIGFYSVFQGVVLTAVAQSNTIHCRQSWGPASLSLLASLVTLASVHFKLRSYSKLRRSLDKEERDSMVLHEQISELKAKGGKFNFSWFNTKSVSKDSQSNKPKKPPKGLRSRYYWAVMVALFIFSTIVFLCCIIVLCGQTLTCAGS